MNTICHLVVAITLLGILNLRAEDSKNPAIPKVTVAKKADSTPKVNPTAATEKLDLTRTQEDKLLTLLNQGSEEELNAINGIAATRARSIISARPFGSVHEVILVPGVGNATFERIKEHGKTLLQSGAKSGKS